MSNTKTKAEQWTRYIAARPEFPGGQRFLAQFEAGAIRKLCDCGCNSYEFEPTSQAAVPLLAVPDGKYGSVFEVSFQVLNGEGTLEFALFADGDGRLAGLDVDYCANTFPVPEDVQLAGEPLHLRISEALLR